jgi:hypothetical protein
MFLAPLALRCLVAVKPAVVALATSRAEAQDPAVAVDQGALEPLPALVALIVGDVDCPAEEERMPLSRVTKFNRKNSARNLET